MLYILQYTSNKSYLQLISYSRVIKYAFLFLVKFFQSVRFFLRERQVLLSVKAYSVVSFSNSALKFWEYIFDTSNYKKIQKKNRFFWPVKVEKDSLIAAYRCAIYSINLWHKHANVYVRLLRIWYAKYGGKDILTFQHLHFYKSDTMNMLLIE